jgi:hypothetical protein
MVISGPGRTRPLPGHAGGGSRGTGTTRSAERAGVGIAAASRGPDARRARPGNAPEDVPLGASSRGARAIASRSTRRTRTSIGGCGFTA